MCIKLFCQIVKVENQIFELSDAQHASVLTAQSQCMAVLRNFYKSEDIFLDLFEDEYKEMCKTSLNIESLFMDPSILLPPTGTPLTGIEFTRRLPCGEEEKARRSIRVYLYLRKLCQQIANEEETILPLTNRLNCYQIDNVMDLSEFEVKFKISVKVL